ncbi:unnamed protein product, partial [Closterium sp. NIES-54]
FSRTNGDGGTVPINLSGETYVIWAFSRGMLDAFGYHDFNRGLATVDFLCNKDSTILMNPGENVATIPGANVDQDPYAGLTPAEREAKEARRERPSSEARPEPRDTPRGTPGGTGGRVVPSPGAFLEP